MTRSDRAKLKGEPLFTGGHRSQLGRECHEVSRGGIFPFEARLDVVVCLLRPCSPGYASQGNVILLIAIKEGIGKVYIAEALLIRNSLLPSGLESVVNLVVRVGGENWYIFILFLSLVKHDLDTSPRFSNNFLPVRVRGAECHARNAGFHARWYN